MKLATLVTLTTMLVACDGTNGSFYIPPSSDAAELRRIENRQIEMQYQLDNLQNQQGGVGVVRGVRY